jgi:hypothetical protein
MNVQDMLNPQELDYVMSPRKEKAETFTKRPTMHDKSTQTTNHTKETTEKLDDTISTSPSTTSQEPRKSDPDKPIKSTESPDE